MSETDKKEEIDDSDDDGLNELKQQIAAAEEVRSILSRKGKVSLKKPIS